MEPRRNDSKAWTELPTDFKNSVIEVLAHDMQPFEGPWLTYVEGHIYPQEILVSIGYARPNQLIQHHFDLSWDRPENGDQELVLSQIHSAFDLLRKVLLEHLEADGINELPLHWQQLPQTKMFFLYSRRNNELEEAASRLLGADEDGLLKGELAAELNLDSAADCELEEGLGNTHQLH